MYLLGSPDTHAQVYLSLTEHGIACLLRDVLHAKLRRTVKHQGQVRTLKALAGIEIAATALTLVREPAERTWKEDA